MSVAATNSTDPEVSRSMRGNVVVRAAGPRDNQRLLRLAPACPMDASRSICVRRDPDFFTLNRLQGNPWQVAVAENDEGEIVGCIGMAERLTYLRGQPTRTVYVSDLKVQSAYRGTGVADRLVHYAREWSERAGRDAVILMTALAGNRAIERRARGPRGLPRLTPFATVRMYSIPLLRWRLRDRATLHVERPTDPDIDEMVELWHRLAPERQFSPVLRPGRLLQFLNEAPGLNRSSFRLVRRSGRLMGFAALWDQRSFKETVLLRYGWRDAALCRVLNTVARLRGGASLPKPGQALRYVSAYHLCVPALEPTVLRALIASVCEEYRVEGHAFLAVGLDATEPLNTALRGLWALPTDIRAYVSTPRGRYTGPTLAERPLHFETALA